MKKRVLSIGVLVSGNGTNLQAIIDAIKGKKLDAKIRIVISNNKDAFALTRARRSDIPTVVVERKDFALKNDFEDAVIKHLKDNRAEIVCLAGFMRILSKRFLVSFPQKIINIHPAILPSFPGLHAQRQAVEHGVRVSGCTVHFVDEGTDTGPIILQRSVPVFQNDNEETLSKRILKEEHKAYPEAIQLIAEGRVKIKDRRVYIVP